MIPTREQIESVCDIITVRLGAVTPETRNVVDFIYRAALEKLDAMPFQPGETVEHKEVPLIVLVTNDGGVGEVWFCGAVLAQDGTGNKRGDYSRKWVREQFTRKTTNS